jgi:hypothetical protein
MNRARIAHALDSTGRFAADIRRSAEAPDQSLAADSFPRPSRDAWHACIAGPFEARLHRTSACIGYRPPHSRGRSRKFVMASLKHTFAVALLTVSATVSSPLSAAQIGGPVTTPRDPGGSWLDTWVATVCIGRPFLNNVQCQTLFYNTGSQCHSGVTALLGMGWWVLNPCEPSSP